MDTMARTSVPVVDTANQPIGCINFWNTTMVCEWDGTLLFAFAEDGFIVWSAPGYWESRDSDDVLMSDSDSGSNRESDNKESEEESDSDSDSDEETDSDSDEETETEDETVYYDSPYSDVGLGSGEV
jgi:hypothetical protein